MEYLKVAGSRLDNPTDLEELVAWMDGELPADRARDVAGLVDSDPRWRRTHLE
ncbi:hypothetical protein LCGC14_1944870, partial [marine sediment metagenome]